VSDFLQQHAMQHVWCTPEQDRQAIIKPVRYGKVRGVYERIKIGWSELKVPTTDNYYVYQIGHYPPSLFGLNGVVNQWTALTKLSTESKCTINIYSGTGLILPLFETFIIQLENKTVLLAIKENSVVDMGNEDIFFHHYTNAFWTSNRVEAEMDFWISGIRKEVDNEAEVLVLYNKYHTAKLLGKKPQAILNGYMVDNLMASSIKVGDSVEIRVDGSIEEMHDIDIDDLHFNYSTLDNIRKYIVDLGYADTIHYHDDIEIRICKIVDGNCIKGLLFHRNQPTNVRMLASATYSISVDQVEYLRQLINDGSCHIRLIVRKAGWNRSLLFENSRLHELNKLPKERRRDILSGRYESCNLWTLSALEGSAYPKVMRLPKIDATSTIDLYRCYGYNAIAYYVADNQARPDTSTHIHRMTTPLPYLKGTMIEYGPQGQIVDVKGAREDGIAYPEDSTVLAEFFEDEALINCPDYFNTEIVPAGKSEYRFYHRLKGTQEWMDISNSITWSDNVDGYISHGYTSSTHEWIVRCSGWAWNRTFMVKPRQGVLEVSLMDDLGTVELPFRNIIVRVNGNELVQDIDFIIYRQTIWIISKRYLKIDDTDNEVFIFAYGFPEDDDQGLIEWGKPTYVGYVDHGMISVDTEYNLHSSLLYRPIVDGKYVLRSTIEHHEDSNGIKGNMRNGAPYSINIIRPKLQSIGMSISAESSLRSDAVDRDKIVSDYLSVHSPIPDILTVSALSERYQLYSIFTARLLDDLMTGVLVLPKVRMLDSVIRTLVFQYEHLLVADAAYIGMNGAFEEGLVTVRPHLKDTLQYVSQDIYSFLDRVSLLYLHGRVDMTGHLAITLSNEE
jgi:hypothetical protein